MTKTLNDIRAEFLNYFAGHGHEVLPSSSLVPHNDPTLMFANAGMNQFKDIFTGKEKPKAPRAATAQKVVRAGGKHNDLDNVGYTARHHTFFEMLGNFSFGDYFKEEAIFYGWDFLTKTMGLNPEKLCVTVYHDDDFAWNTWKKITGFADHKIIRIATNDNFWSMGDTGPCGPCSEIFYDHGEKIWGGPPGSAEADGDRFVEIWNLVFMQYEQMADGNRVNLPKPSIDTGMGLERITAVVQGVHDNYDIDLFQNMMQESRKFAAKLGARDQLSVKDQITAHRVLADHLRSSCFLIADGVMPSNEGRGYVLRRIMRRAMRYAHQLGCAEPLMYHLVPNFVALMGGQYPELKRAEATISENLKSEEERFKQTLERGLKLLEEETANLSKGGTLKGKTAFKLYDTYGFPLDLTQDILRGRGMSVDVADFDASMEQQKEMARANWKGSGEQAVGNLWFELKEKLGATEFVGYDADEAEAEIIAIVKQGESIQQAHAGDQVSIVLSRTPFYGESGGQVGDKGMIILDASLHPELTTTELCVCTIKDTQKPLDNFIVHTTDPLMRDLNVGDKIKARIFVEERNKTRAHHSATHLLHKALRDQLGEHVTQKGSLVAPDKLRFDFSHGKAVSKEEIAAIESEVNAIIVQGEPVGCKVMTPDAAIAAGAMALFGEKYGDQVRVLSMGTISSPRRREVGRGALNAQISNDEQECPHPNPLPKGEGAVPYSVELCGGTHVRNLGDIGAFKITSEGSVASGIRRIEAVTGESVRAYYIEQIEKLLEQAQKLSEDQKQIAPNAKPALPEVKLDEFKAAKLDALHALYAKVSGTLQQAIDALVEQNKKLQKDAADAKRKEAMAAIADVKPEKIGAVNFISASIEGVGAKELRPIAEALLKQAEPGIAVVAASDEGKAAVIVGVSQSITAQYSAVDLVKLAVEKLGGKGGGGKPDFAQGGGPDANNLSAAIQSVKIAIK